MEQSPAFSTRWAWETAWRSWSRGCWHRAPNRVPQTGSRRLADNQGHQGMCGLRAAVAWIPGAIRWIADLQPGTGWWCTITPPESADLGRQARAKLDVQWADDVSEFSTAIRVDGTEARNAGYDRGTDRRGRPEYRRRARRAGGLSTSPAFCGDGKIRAPCAAILRRLKRVLLLCCAQPGRSADRSLTATSCIRPSQFEALSACMTGVQRLAHQGVTPAFE